MSDRAGWRRGARFPLAAFLAVTVGACAPTGPGTSPAAVGPADTIITDARIYTLDPVQPWAETAAIVDGRYVYVGGPDGIAAYRGADTRVVQLNGRMVMPGINDAHSHPWQGGLKVLYQCSFPFSATPDEVAAALRGCLAENPDIEWLEGGQWTSDFFRNFAIASPRAWLDQISSEVAIVLHDDATHNCWVNSRALQMGGIDRDTPDPDGGRIVRDADGRPNGLLYESARRVLLAARPPWTVEQYRGAIAEAVRQANRFGLTGVNEARVQPPMLDAYRQLDEAGELTAHVTANHQTPREYRDYPLRVEEYVRLREQYRLPHVNTSHVKIFLDGVPTASRTALMLAEYLTDADHPEATSGFLLVDAEVLKQDLIALDRAGFTVKMHAAGDGAVRVALDAIAAARAANGASGQRHQLAHAGYIDPADMPRFAALDAVADSSPYLWYPSPIMGSLIGAIGERGRHYYPIRDLLDSGAEVAIGSDWPSAAVNLSPWGAIEALVTRRDPASDASEALWPEQAVSLAEALRIATVGGARALGIDQISGSIEPGKSADFIVLDRQLFDIPITAVSDTRVEQTWFEGRPVYREGE
jgi:predicted amidohydrolase YtcJ